MIFRVVFPLIIILTGMGLSGCVRKLSEEVFYVPPIVDLGKVNGKTRTIGHVEIRNESQSAVKISRIDASCSCTVVNEILPIIIDPNNYYKCNFEFDPTSLSGVVERQLVFFTDIVESTELEAPKPIAFVTKVRAFVIDSRLPNAIPNVVDFGRFGVWEDRRESITIINRGSVALELLNLPQHYDGCFAELLHSNGKESTVLITPSRAGLYGSLKREVSIKTNQGDVIVAVRGTQFEWMFLQSDIVTLQRNPQEESWIKEVTLEHDSQVPTDDIVVESDNLAVDTLQVVELGPGRSKFVFKLSLLDRTKCNSATLRFSTSHFPSTYDAKVYFVN